ncbi:CHAD domain-containing protein [Mesorhizobium sp. WSM2239]|uniref:CHAD domain-containing protein n=2 Tax=unclassified Mesorhizobium TaxID=325217 RepID=A0AAU8D8W1_9HYPH
MSYRIDPRLPVTGEIRRIAADEIGKAIGDLTASRTKPEKGLHACRKRFKKLRALFRLVRPGNEQFCRTENERYRDISRSLAGAREDTALIETIDRLVKAFPGQTSAGELDAVRSALVARRDAPVRERIGLKEMVDAAVEACEQGRSALPGLVLPDLPEAAAEVLADGAGKTLRRARRVLDAAGKRGQPEDFHELRKCVKAHRIHVLLLHRFWPRPVKSRRWALDALGERLGELNDIFVMRQLIKSNSEALGSKEQLKLLCQLMRRSEKALRKQCLREAELLFGKARKPMVRKIADRYQAGASHSQPGINQ